MKTSIIPAIITLFYISTGFSVIPLATSPSWTSSDNDYSTGGALCDVTMDQLLDFCMGNGNDMAFNHNAVYVNSAGALETIASWRSIETGYYSHIYMGDVDNDGYPDMAISYLGSGSTNQGPASVYRNSGTGLNTTAWWASTDQYNSFDCALGDVDLDGDLDIAVVAGDPYSGITAPARVYRNNSGSIETTPYWTSTDNTPSDACRWVDMNNDGWLDLVIGYRRKIAVFTNVSGTLQTTASWSTTTVGWVLRIAVGDYNHDGYKDIAVANNGQLSGDQSRIEVYRNSGGTLQTPAQYVMLTGTDYCSCVEWGDANNDTWLDLAAGGWWEPAVVFENTAGSINTAPAWSYNGGSNLVGETVTWGDTDNSSVITMTDYFSGNGSRKLYYLSKHPVQRFQEARINSLVAPLSDFAYDRLTGWISFKNAPSSGTNNIEVKYSYARYPDLGLTNWDPGNGNYLFGNTITGVEETAAVEHGTAGNLKLTAYPNPFSGQTAIKFQISNTKYQMNSKSQMVMKIFNASGRLVKQFNHLSANQHGGIQPFNQVIWDGTDDSDNPLPAGVYIVQARTDQGSVSEKLILTR